MKFNEGVNRNLKNVAASKAQDSREEQSLRLSSVVESAPVTSCLRTHRHRNAVILGVIHAEFMVYWKRSYLLPVYYFSVGKMSGNK